MSGSGRFAALGDYDVVRAIARGGMGSVLEVVNRRSGARYAAKTLTRALDPTARARFRREAELLARCGRHPGIVRVHAVGETPAGAPYLILDLVEGETLERALERAGRLDPSRAARLVLEISRALGFMHAQGILHRDVKPSNVLLEGGLDGTPRLTDFGLATTDDVTRLTKTGQFVGTLAYCSPEQATGRPASAASDVFSLGCVLFHALAGEPPVKGDSGLEVVARLADDGPLRDVRELAKETPAALAGLVARAIAKAPEERYPDANALARDLERFQAGGLEAPRPPRGKRRGVLIVGGLVLVLAIGAALFRTTSTPTAAKLEAPEDPAVAKEHEGDARLAAGDPRGAEVAYTEALALDHRRQKELRVKRGGAAAAAGDDRKALSDFALLVPDPLALPDDRARNEWLAPLAPALYRRGLGAGEAGLRDLESGFRIAAPPPERAQAVLAVWLAHASGEEFMTVIAKGPNATERDLDLARTQVAFIRRAASIDPAAAYPFWEAGAKIRPIVKSNPTNELFTRILERVYPAFPDSAAALLLSAYRSAVPRERFDLAARGVAALPPALPGEPEEVRIAARELAIIIVENAATGSDMDRALPAAERARSIEAWTRLSFWYRGRKLWGRAAEAIARAEALEPASSDEAALLARERVDLLVDTGKGTEGVALAREAYEKDASAERLYTLAAALESSGAVTELADLVEPSAVAVNTVGGLTLEAMMRARLELGRVEDARDLVGRVGSFFRDRMRSGFAAGLARRAGALWARGRRDESVALVRSEHEKDPTPASLAALVRVLAKVRGHDQEIVDLVSAAKVEDDGCLLPFGQALVALGRTDEAKALATRLEPGHPAAAFQIEADRLVALGRRPEAVALVRDAHEKRLPGALTKLGLLLVDDPEPSTRGRSIEEVAAFYDRDKEENAAVGIALARLGRLDDARAVAERLERRDPWGAAQIRDEIAPPTK
jgi:tRNA A-37 threonylcarbamoyl transferase component Bud32/tetratricopeptide (TPR) repeat protein